MKKKREIMKEKRERMNNSFKEGEKHENGIWEIERKE